MDMVVHYEMKWENIVLDKENRHYFWKELARVIRDGQYTYHETEILLDIINVTLKTSSNKKEILDEFLKFRCNTKDLDRDAEIEVELKRGVSFLHVAASYQPNSPEGATIINHLIHLGPDLIFSTHDGCNYKGQTPLHIAIAKENIRVTKTILASLSKHRHLIPTRTRLLSCIITGSAFKGTSLMGELPLNIAALTFNKEMVETLLTHGASLTHQNTKGETVIHSLVEYAAYNPGRTMDVIDMIQYFVNILTLKNPIVSCYNFDINESNCQELAATALRLAARRGLKEIFESILDIEDVYKYAIIMREIRSNKYTKFDTGKKYLL